MKKKIAVVLSGCGYTDGTEITEAVSVLVNLSELGVQYEVFAPDRNFPLSDTEDTRNALTESSRISRGQSQNLKLLLESNFDGLVFPGGYGAAKNLCTFADEGAKGKVLPEVQNIVLNFFKASKPICAICIAPALLALSLKNKQLVLTIGNDKSTAEEIEKTGNFHQECPVLDYVSDRENKIITTPAYMYEAKPHEVFKGIQSAIRELVEMA